DDLAHRSNCPMGWQYYGFACRKELDAGRLAGLSTGGDGGYRFRATTGELTERERNLLAGSWPFRMRVRHGRVLLDNVDCLPNSEFCDEAGDDHCGWIPLDNGDYRLTVHAVEWEAEPDVVDENGYARPHALPSYVLQFEPVADIASIEVPS